jgi:hypothetical protein
VTHLSEIGLETGDEHEQQDTDAGEVANQRKQRARFSARSPAEHAPAEQVQRRGAQHDADENLAEDGGLMKPRRQRAGDLGRGDDDREQQQNLE